MSTKSILPVKCTLYSVHRVAHMYMYVHMYGLHREGACTKRNI